MIPLVYYALVTDTKDPLGLGRVAVKLKGFPADVTLTDIWLRMVMPAANNLTGILWLPEVGDEVAVLRAGGDTLEGMLILGAVYNGTNLPIYKNADGDNITKEFRTKAGNAITFTDTAGEETVTIATAKATITVAMCNKEKGSVTIQGADTVLVKAVTSMTFEAKEIALTGETSITLTSGSAKVSLANNNLEAAGGTVKLEGSSKVDVVAPAINLG